MVLREQIMKSNFGIGSSASKFGRRTVLLVEGGVMIGSYIMQWCNC